MITDLRFLYLHFNAAHPAFEGVVERFRAVEKKACIAETSSTGSPLLFAPFGLEADMKIAEFLFGGNGTPDLTGDMDHAVLYCKNFIGVFVETDRIHRSILFVIIAHHIGWAHITIP